MADLLFIQAAVDWLVGVLGGADLAAELEAAGMAPFGEVRKSWTGVVTNANPVAVMPRTTGFDAEGSGRHEVHELTVRFGVSGSEPDALTNLAMAYMAQIDQAVNAALWPGQEAGSETPVTFSRVFVVQHDYGPLYAMEGSFARFPEMHIAVEAYEYDGAL